MANPRLRERDEAQSKLADQQALVDESGKSLSRLQKDLKNVRGENEALQKKADDLQKSAEAVTTLKDEKKALETKVIDLEEKAAEIETLKDIQSGKLPRNYMIAWYAAVAGWGLAILLGLGWSAATVAGEKAGISAKCGSAARAFSHSISTCRRRRIRPYSENCGRSASTFDA